MAPLRTKRSLCGETLSRKSSLSSAYRVSMRWKFACFALAMFWSRVRTDAVMFFTSRTIGDHRFEIGPQDRPNTGLAGIPDEF